MLVMSSPLSVPTLEQTSAIELLARLVVRFRAVESVCFAGGRSTKSPFAFLACSIERSMLSKRSSF